MAIPTAEELKKLTPEQRIKQLREMELRKKRELEETKKQVEQELAAAEELIKDTQDEQEVDAALAQEEERVREERNRDEAENLEERIAQETVVAQPPAQYGTNLYNTLERATDALEQLYGNPVWNAAEQQVYRDSKEQIERAQSYRLTSEKLEEDLGLATGILNRLRYRH